MGLASGSIKKRQNRPHRYWVQEIELPPWANKKYRWIVNILISVEGEVHYCTHGWRVMVEYWAIRFIGVQELFCILVNLAPWAFGPFGFLSSPSFFPLGRVKVQSSSSYVSRPHSPFRESLGCFESPWLFCSWIGGFSYLFLFFHRIWNMYPSRFVTLRTFFRCILQSVASFGITGPFPGAPCCIFYDVGAEGY